MEKLTPKQFLSSHGIELEATQLLSFIEGYMRAPDLCYLMTEYHKAKLAELDLAITNEDIIENKGVCFSILPPIN